MADLPVPPRGDDDAMTLRHKSRWTDIIGLIIELQLLESKRKIARAILSGPRLFVDGSERATGGLLNPCPMISAPALRAGSYIPDNFRQLSGATRAVVAA